MALLGYYWYAAIYIYIHSLIPFMVLITHTSILWWLTKALSSCLNTSSRVSVLCTPRADSQGLAATVPRAGRA